MGDETFKEVLRKKVMDLKADSKGFYSETYNIVSVLSSLNPDTPEIIRERLYSLYKQPSEKYGFNLPQAERLYYSYQDDPNFKARGKVVFDMDDLKVVLDRVRRDLLFYLALIEDKPKNYNIMLEKVQAIP
jgi:hypothetical protein